MDARLTELSLDDFSEELAARNSRDAASYAEALMHDLAVVFHSMAQEFPKFPTGSVWSENIIQRMLREVDFLWRLEAAGATAFDALSQAYGIPKDDPTRADVLEEATRGAIKTSMEMMEQVCRTIEFLDQMEILLHPIGSLEEMGQEGSRMPTPDMLLSDVGCGASLARAALEAASLNVFVNTKTLRDRKFAQMVERHCDEMLKVYVPEAESVERSVKDVTERVDDSPLELV